MVARLAALAVLFLALPAVAARYLGPTACRSCHLSAYEIWSASAHARAFSVLTPDERQNATCLACHAPDRARGGSSGVTCETCHGAGQYYAPVYVMKDSELARATGLVIPGAQSCTRCHDANSPSLTAFDAAMKMHAIDHWTGEKKARADAAGKGGSPQRQRSRRVVAPKQAKDAAKQVRAGFRPAKAGPPAAALVRRGVASAAR